MNPLKRLFRYSDNVSFEFSGDTTQAVDRLSRSASRPILQATFSSDPSNPSLVGGVSKERVRLHKVTPLLGNAFKPIFVGKFQSQNGKSSLVGFFEMGAIGKIVISVFVFFTLAMQILLLPGIGTESGLGIFEPTLFLCGGILLVLIFKAYSKKDVAWIEHHIESVLR